MGRIVDHYAIAVKPGMPHLDQVPSPGQADLRLFCLVVTVGQLPAPAFEPVKHGKLRRLRLHRRR
jgi:hypothetical protein